MVTKQLPDDHNVLLGRFSQYLHEERYGSVTQRYRATVKSFLAHLEAIGLTVHTVQPSHIDRYLASMRRQLDSAARGDLSEGTRAGARSGIHLLLRLIHGSWPPSPVPQSPREVDQQEIIRDYDFWMHRLRGLSVKSRSHRCADAGRFLNWLETGGKEGLRKLVVSDIDLFLRWRMESLKRSAKQHVAVNLRCFLRYLFSARLAPDLASTVVGPKIYTYEHIPSALRAEEIEKVVQYVRRDRSRIGLRDYAILMLLTTYGMRAGEITALRLDDIDWQHGRLRIHHSKTEVHSELPLLTVPGEAILDYLRAGRPETTIREVFLRAVAPYRALKSGSSLHAVLGSRLRAAGVIPRGRRGPHAFRHAKAVGLLKAAVPLKVVGDVLGHRSPESTLTYLKLDVDALRGVALDIPGVGP